MVIKTYMDLSNGTTYKTMFIDQSWNQCYCIELKGNCQNHPDMKLLVIEEVNDTVQVLNAIKDGDAICLQIISSNNILCDSHYLLTSNAINFLQMSHNSQ